jgi:hypothetical protein
MRFNASAEEIPRDPPVKSEEFRGRATGAAIRL